MGSDIAALDIGLLGMGAAEWPLSVRSERIADRPLPASVSVVSSTSRLCMLLKI